jgi:hypothetical protein
MSEYKISKLYPHLEVYKDGKVYSRLANRFLKLSLNLHGYYFVSSRFNGKKKNIYVHRLVATEYQINPLKKQCVNHIDGVKTNNNANNLEWCTHKENVNHAILNGLFKNNSRSITDKKINILMSQVKPWSRDFGLSVIAKNNGIPYKTAKNWYKKYKEQQSIR